MSLLRKFARDRKAVTALEYGLIASLIAVAIISSITHLGGNIANTFSFVASKL